MNDNGTQYFIITSHGWSGSKWTASAFSTHPEAICTHSAMNIMPDRIQNLEELRHNLGKLHKGYVGRFERSVDDAYEDIVAQGSARAYGSVHLYRLRDLHYLMETFGPFKRPYVVFNQVRHPLSLVWSGYGEFRTNFRFDINELHWTLGKVLDSSRDFVFSLARKYDLMIGDFENLAFVCAACILGSLRKDIEAEARVRSLEGCKFMGHIQMESMTSDSDMFRRVFEQATGMTLGRDSDYLRDVFSMGNINQHRLDSKIMSPAERFNSLPEWQKETFRYYLGLFDIRGFYESLGYDFSFLEG